MSAMYGKKTLIVVYKDEMLMNQLKKLVETCDDTEEDVVGTSDNSVNIVSWTEKVWLGNKKAGNIQGKILFLGEVKGTDKLIPVIDMAFDEYGVKFGWAGNQAVVYAAPKVLTSRKDYDAFLEKLASLPVPDFLKTTRKSIVDIGADTPLENEEDGQFEPNESNHARGNLFEAAKEAFSAGADAIGKVGAQIASKSEEVFRNKSLVKRQMLFYGVVRLYNDGLEKFINA